MIKNGIYKKTTNNTLKITSIPVLFILSFGFGILPYCITSCKTNSKILGLANSFSGGLFLGIGLFHILPEAAEILEDLSDLPVAHIIAFASYAVILFVEKIAFNSHSLIHDTHEQNNKIITNNNHIETEELEETKIKISSSTEIIQIYNNDSNDSKTGITPYILLLALGFHGFFEGMALGMQTQINGTLFLLIAISAHKWAVSLTLGISFLKNKICKKKLIIMLFIFSLIGPVGVILGLVLMKINNENIEGIFLAVSTGTFLYISCSEIIVEEFEKEKNKYCKYLMFILGGLFSAGLSFMEVSS